MRRGRDPIPGESLARLDLRCASGCHMQISMKITLSRLHRAAACMHGSKTAKLNWSFKNFSAISNCYETSSNYLIRYGIKQLILFCYVFKIISHVNTSYCLLPIVISLYLVIRKGNAPVPCSTYLRLRLCCDNCLGQKPVKGNLCWN